MPGNEEGAAGLVALVSSFPLRCGMVRYGMVWYGMVWFGIALSSTVWYGLVWYGMVWYGKVCFGMVWFVMVWYGVLLYGKGWFGMVSSCILDGIVWWNIHGIVFKILFTFLGCGEELLWSSKE